ncbi:MAG: hypothetical protein CMF96_03715 [Candidatus Marinimicrobia bacterium]|mgnify:CR=1 FL=1|nr:hypothetical protein [Candidatus Neomarinimicrobiota bacterium]
MSIRNLFTEKMILPFSDVISSKNISSSLKFLRESQKWTADEIKNFQNKKLRQLINHSYNNVPYYNELFKKISLLPSDIKTIEDLQKLPILTKKSIKENIANGKLLASNFNKRVFLKNSSSGSTGEPLQFYETATSYGMNIAANLRGWYGMGYRLGDCYVKLSVNPRSSKVKRIQDYVNNCLYFSSKGVNDHDIIRFLELIRKWKPKILRGYPSTLSVIANYIINNNIEITGISAINTTGEILFDEMKISMEKAFCTKVFDSYSGEGGATMFQNNEGVYHIAHEYAITELINVSKGSLNTSIGEVITTDLWNYANPFIRYAVNDKVEVYKSNDTKPMIAKKILGRNVDMLKTPKGKVLIVHFFTGYFEWISTVDQFQIRQDSPKDFILSLVVNGSFTSFEEKKIFDYVQNYIGEDAILHLNITKEIPVQKNGKTRFMLKNF